MFISVVFFSIVLCPFDKARKVVHAHAFLWSDLLIALNPYWNVEVDGLQNIDKTKTYIIVANHQSLTDIVLMYQTKMQFKWIANEGVFKVPFIGWSLKLAKHIKIRKGNLKSVRKAYRESLEWLRYGISVMIFPEGTRSNINKMGEFQSGAFKLALKERIPILPIAIKGADRIIPKGSWLFTTKATVRFRVLEPVDTAGVEAGDFENLRDLVRARIEAA